MVQTKGICMDKAGGNMEHKCTNGTANHLSDCNLALQTSSNFTGFTFSTAAFCLPGMSSAKNFLHSVS